MFTTQWQGESTRANFFCVSCLWIGPLIFWIHMVISCYEWSHCVDSVLECDLCERRAVQGCFYCCSKADMMMNRQRKLLNLPRSTSTYVCWESSGASSLSCFLWFHLSTSILSLFCLFVPSVLIATFVSFSFQEFCISPCDLWALCSFHINILDALSLSRKFW